MVFKLFCFMFTFMVGSVGLASNFENNPQKPVLVKPNFEENALVSKEAPKMPASKSPFTLSPESTITLRGEIGAETVSKTITALMTNTSNTVTLFLSSPGGSVLDGAQLVQAIRNVNKKVVCLIDFSASMSFVIFQACDERIVMDASILMQHVPSVGVRFQPQPNLESFINFLKQVTDSIESAQAKRLKLSTEQFKKLVRNDFWLFGSEAVKMNAADRVAPVVCSPELVNKDDQEVLTFGRAKIIVTWSACPLITVPKSVDFGKDSANMSAAQLEKLHDFVNKKIDYKQSARRMMDEAMGTKQQEE